MSVGLLLAFSTQAAVIYKWVDADGVVHYSDQSAPGAEKIFTASAPSSGPSSGPRNNPGPAPKKPPASALNYSEFVITSPAPEQTFFGDDIIGVHLSLVPGLKINHSLVWHLNGKELDNPSDPLSFTIPRQDRGTFNLTATITDQATGESQSSNSVTFYVRQPSQLAPLSPQHH
ncbi:MAG TPA: DUF4124 domain-containing protein [Steroidobacteraceae bacterium]